MTQKLLSTLVLLCMTAVTAWAATENVTYKDENGLEKQVDATVLTGSETSIGTENQTTWYVVSSDLSYTHALNIAMWADVRLIICDGKTMNIGTSSSPISSSENDGVALGTTFAGAELTIYGQTNSTGALNAYGSNYGIRLGGDYKQYGGRVTATGGDNGVSASSSFTITRGTLSATGGNYGHGIYANGDINLNGGTVTATSTKSDGIYSNNRSIILAGATVTASSYYGCHGVMVANCQTYSDGSSYYSGTLTSDEQNAIKGKTMTLYGYLYIDADGNKAAKTFSEVTVLTGSETSLGTSGEATWYALTSDLDYTNGIDIAANADVHLILVDGKTMNIGTSSSPVSGIGLGNEDDIYGRLLTIYGQTNSTGVLNVYGTDGGIKLASSYTQNGGVVNVSATSGNAIWTYSDITLKRGVTTATSSNAKGIFSQAGNINLGGATVTANGYFAGYGVKVADGLTYSDGISHYSGTLTNGQVAAIEGKTIMPLVTGECGESGSNLTWIYDQVSKALTISGTGTMANYSSNSQPWNSYRQDIQSIVIGSGVETIGEYAFRGCSNFTTLLLPASVQSIGSWAFVSCSGLKTVTIGSGVKYIYNDAFYGSNAVTDVYCYADPSGLTWTEDGCDDFKSGKATICHVADASAWSSFVGTVNVTFQSDLAPTATTASVNGAYWSTYYNSAANMKADANTTVYKAAVNGTTVELTEISDKVINAGQAVILKRSEEGAVSLTPQATASTDDYSDNILHGVDVRTATSAIKTTLGDGTLYVLGNKNAHFGFHKYTAAYMPANKAFLLINDGGAALARDYFEFNFDETTNIASMSDVKGKMSDVWYTINGVKLASKPTQKGIYIVNGRKEVIR